MVAGTLYIKQYIMCVWFLCERDSTLKHSFEVDQKKNKIVFYAALREKIKDNFSFAKDIQGK